MSNNINKSHKALISFLSSIPIFSQLEDEIIKYIASSVTEVKFNKGDIIFKRGTFINTFYIIKSGEIMEFVTYKDNISSSVTTRYAGDYLGEVGIILETPYITTTLAKTKTTLLSISKENFSKLLWTNKSILVHIIKTLTDRLQCSADKVICFTSFKAEGRLAYTLMLISEEHDNSNSIKATHEYLATYCGIARQTASKILSSWNKAGIISTSYGKIKIINSNALFDIILEYN